MKNFLYKIYILITESPWNQHFNLKNQRNWKKTSLNVKFFDWDYLHLTALMEETYFSKNNLLIFFLWDLRWKRSIHAEFGPVGYAPSYYGSLYLGLWLFVWIQSKKLWLERRDCQQKWGISIKDSKTFLRSRSF